MNKGMDVEAASTLALAMRIQPGDGTAYEFLVSRSTYYFPKDYILIAKGGDGPEFGGYPYQITSIQQFMLEHRLFWQDYESYEKYVDDNKILDASYVGYVVGHSKCDRWTALAAIIAGFTFLVKMNMIEEVDDE